MGRSDAKYYRYNGRVVCVIADANADGGQRLVVPEYTKRLGQKTPAIASMFPPLPKHWRKLIAEAIAQRDGEGN